MSSGRIAMSLKNGRFRQGFRHYGVRFLLSIGSIITNKKNWTDDKEFAAARADWPPSAQQRARQGGRTTKNGTSKSLRVR